jgi:hypothetical protein
MREITETTTDRLPVGLVIAGCQLIQAPFDSCEASVDRGQFGEDGVHRGGGWLVTVRWGITTQQGVEVFGVPAQGHRERFQGAGITAALGGVAVQLAHDGDRDLSLLRQLALSPMELGQPCIDRCRDRRPVLLHVFLRAPPLSAEE